MAEHEDVVWMHTERVISIVELARYCEVEESQVRELVDYGALEPTDPGAEPLAFDADRAPQVRSALRLCRDLELESATVPLVLSLLERIHELERSVRDLTARLGRP
jgi:chaperone modulatory protein CbpM